MRKLVGCPECAAIFGVDLDPTPTAEAERAALIERFAAAALTGWLANRKTRVDLFAKETAHAVWDIAGEMVLALDERQNSHLEVVGRHFEVPE